MYYAFRRREERARDDRIRMGRRDADRGRREDLQRRDDSRRREERPGEKGEPDKWVECLWNGFY